MLSKFWEGVSAQLSERWVATLFTPAFLFWFGGLGAWLWNHRRSNGLESLESLLVAQTQPLRVALLIGALAIVSASAFVAQALDLGVLRFLEGYWPRQVWGIRGLRRWLVSFQSRRIDKLETEFQALAGKEITEMTSDERERYVELDLRLTRYPSDPADRMPTRLGNIIRASENRPREKYGLDAVICWYRIWLLIPEKARDEVQQARGTLDTAARTFFWGFLFLLWTPWAFWAVPLSILAMAIAYRASLRAAETFGDLIQATFDLYRWQLYDALRWPSPRDPSEERAIGEAVTQYLWRGSDAQEPVFAVPSTE